MEQRILVIGATGMLGKPVSLQLHTDGFKVKVLARDPERAKNKLGNGFEIVAGNVTDPGSLMSAMDDCDCVHINLSSSTFKELHDVEYRGSLNIIRAAVSKQLKRLTIITGAGVRKENTWAPMIRTRYHIEKEIISSGVPYTIFAPTHFMESIPKYIKGDRALIFGRQPHKIHWVAAADYAKMVSHAFQRKDTENKKFWIMGPEAFTMEEAITMYCKVKCPGISISRIPLSMMGFMATITFKSQFKYVVKTMKYFNKAGETGDPQEANELLGKPITTMSMWLNEK
ncbi:MAG: hypothetical protein AMS27_11140 [Bacteroides sp. SM23_62_1]|nr:MAG: hypothetical protein AMS27_11140 [Bacteroides sp. SM23_62_1]